MNLAFAAVSLFRLLTADFKELPQSAIAYLGDPVYIVKVTIITAFVFAITGCITWFIRKKCLQETYQRLLDNGVRQLPLWVAAIECIPITSTCVVLGYFASKFFPATLFDLWPFGLPLVVFAVFLAGLASLQRLWPYELQLASKPLRSIVLWTLLIFAFVTTREFNSKLQQVFGWHTAPRGGTPTARSEVLPNGIAAAEPRDTPLNPSALGFPKEIRFVRLMCSFAFTLSLLWTSNSKIVRILSPWESLE